MDPVSNVDRLILLLRQRLQERASAQARGASARSSGSRAQPVSALRELLSVEGVDERHLRRALIQNLLAESFDRRVLNDAQFQQVIDRVTETIEGDGEASKLLARLVRELKAAAR